MATQVSGYLEPWAHLPGKVVMVTGASSGIGLEFCLDLAKAGCLVVAAARRVDRLRSLCDEINGLSFSGPHLTRAVPVELDVCSDGPTIGKSVKSGWEAFGRIDALINNAGVRGNVRNPLDLSEEEWNDTVKTNLTGTWLVSKYVCIRMRDAGYGGSVINMSSVAGLWRGQLPGGVAYSSSKSALVTLTTVMAMELGKLKIRVNCISPGIFKSEITEFLMEKEWLHNVNQKIIPLKSTGTSDPALTSLVRYLIHDSSEYVSGNVFIVDAGASLPGVPIFSSL